MRKILLALSAFAFATSVANAQHVGLFEEFTGENCPPCAGTNPGLWALTSANPSKIILIKYQVPIPSAGPIYNEYKTEADARRSYYQSQASIFAPSSRHDGIVYPGTYPGHAGYLNQTRIDSVAGLPTSFDISVVGNWNAANDSLYANIVIKAKEAVSNTNLKLRVAFVQSLHFATAPGTNGEKDFEHVVRKMFPSAAGETLPATWTANQTQTFKIGGTRPSHIKTTDNGFWVVWIQDDNNKRVNNAARSAGDAFPTSIKTVSTIGIDNMMIYPNPASTSATVSLNVSENVNAQVNVTDVTGRIVYSTSVTMTAGANQFVVPTENFSNGIYNVSINSTIGSVSQRLSVVK